MFITFEGPEGSGKTTQSIQLKEALVERDYAVLWTREPGGTRIAEQIREVLHRPDNQEMAPTAEILLYSAARAQHTIEKIRPALAAGQIVLCDRYYDSTLAYQGYGRGLDLATLRLVTQFATGGLVPDLTLYFDLDPEEGLQRRQRDQAAEWNRLDGEALAFHRRVHEGYQQLIVAEPGRWVVVDAARAVEAVQAEVLQVVLARLAAR
jgi:dTMP kinase